MEFILTILLIIYFIINSFFAGIYFNDNEFEMNTQHKWNTLVLIFLFILVYLYLLISDKIKTFSRNKSK